MKSELQNLDVEDEEGVIALFGAPWMCLPVCLVLGIKHLIKIVCLLHNAGFDCKPKRYFCLSCCIHDSSNSFARRSIFIVVHYGEAVAKPRF